MREVLGFSAEHFTGTREFWQAHVHVDDLVRAHREKSDLLRAGTCACEYRFRRPDGVFIWLRDEMRLLRNEDGSPFEIVGSWLNVTERKEAEQALRKSEARYRSILENVEEGYYEIDLDGRFLFFNESLCKILCADADLLRNSDCWAFILGPDREEIRGRQKQVLRTGEGVGRAQFQLQRGDGTKTFVETSVYLTRDETGRPRGFHGICRDFSAQVREDLEAQRRREELAHLVRVASLGELASTLAHEINQPLAAMRASAQAAQRFLGETAPNLDEVREALQDIVDSNRRASEVIARMRAFISKGPTVFEPLDLCDVANDVVALVGSEAAARGIDIALRRDRPAPVTGDATQLQQVLLNLVLNSFEAMRDTPAPERRLTIHVESEDDGRVRVKVCDEGVGLSPETAARVFEPFFSTRDGGLGVGLSISRNIMEAHGGAMWCESPLGGGAVFGFDIPRRAP